MFKFSKKSFLCLRIKFEKSSGFVVDPHRFKFGSGSSFFPNVHPDPGQTLKSQKVEFLHEKYTYSSQ
jgi:hypothetical protein